MNTIQQKIQKYVELPWELPPINGDIIAWSLDSSSVLPNKLLSENKSILFFTPSTSSSYISKLVILDIFTLSTCSSKKHILCKLK